jgi:hypothetical protein
LEIGSISIDPRFRHRYPWLRLTAPLAVGAFLIALMMPKTSFFTT